MRYVLDGSVRRAGRVLIGGSPLRLFRLTARGATVADDIAEGRDVAGSHLVDRLLDAGAIHPDVEPAPPGAPATSAVTVVIPVRGRLTASPPPGAIVVDDASPTPVAGAQVRLARHGGPGAARNAGLAMVTTPLVAFVDADVEPPDGWLGPLVAHFADPRVGLVAPRVASAPGPARLERYETTSSPLDMGDEPARIRAGSRVSYVPAAAIVCRVEALRSVGGFDEALRYGEDVDLVWRLDEAGWRCRYEPIVEVRHAPRATWGAWVRQRIGYGSSAAPLARRHPGALAPVRVSGWSALVWLLTAAGHPLLGTATSVATGAALVRKLPDVPARTAFGLATTGNAHAGEAIASAVRRAWLPIVALAALRSRTARRVLIASLLAARDPLRVVDDAAYGVGLWLGMARERTLAPITPRLSSWPGRADVR